MKKAVLVVSFGTSFKENRKNTIDICEEKIKKIFTEYDFFKAYTSNIIITKIKNDENIEIKNPLEVLEKLSQNKYEKIIIQPLFITSGKEFYKLEQQINIYRDKFKEINLGRPLLNNLKDCEEVANAIKYQIPQIDKNEAIIFMGHGTNTNSDDIYKILETVLRNEKINCYISTINNYQEIDIIIKKLKNEKIDTVHLMPLMLVAGKHVVEDMSVSWNNIFEKNNFKVKLHIKGLGENNYIQDKFVKHCLEEI
jgi:sirohydrochlorin cobaltochelatase